MINKFFRLVVLKKNILIIFISLVFFGFLIFINQALSAPPSLLIISEPSPKSDKLPNVIASSTADSGRTVQSAFWRIFPASGSPFGTWYNCTANTGFAFGDNYVEFTCYVPSLSDGEYRMEIIVYDNLSEYNSEQTSDFIVDRVAPVVSFYPLENAPNPINFNNPIFTGSVTDSLTFVTGIEYKYALASTSSGIPGSFGDSGWEACVIDSPNSTSTTFSCDPSPDTFADSVKGDEYRMHVRAVDEVGNLSSFSNFYQFHVDTVDPYDLLITFPTDSGEIFYGNKSMIIDWTTPTDDFELGSLPIKIEYSRNGTFDDTYLIIDGNQSIGPYNWTIPAEENTTQGRIKITATDLATNSISSSSSNPFTIYPYSEPNIIIDQILPLNVFDATSTLPIIITAYASDPQGIISAQYSTNSGGSWDDCSFQDGSESGDSEVYLTCGTFDALDEGEHRIYVRAYDGASDYNSVFYDFIYDSSPPETNISEGDLGLINIATRAGASFWDTYTEVASFEWDEFSGPDGASVNFQDFDIANPFISADTNGDYTVSVNVCDILDNCTIYYLYFSWTNDPLEENFEIINPEGGETLAGGADLSIEWTNPGGVILNHFGIEYFDGSDWFPITGAENINKNTTDYLWGIYSINSYEASIRVFAYDEFNNILLTATSSDFTVDSTAPVVEAGTLGNISMPTSPEAEASDEFSSGPLRYLWTQESGPPSGSINFSGGADILNPEISGTITGSYTARLTVYDGVDNSGTDTASFNWDGNPPGFIISYPLGGEYFRGSSTISIIWEESVGADHYNIYYTTNNWASSSSIDSTINLYYDWTLPEIDSENVIIRVVAVDSYNNQSSADSAIFMIDSTLPEVDAGTFSGIILAPTKPSTVSVFDTGSGIDVDSYLWEKVSGPGNVYFSPSNNILEPFVSADTPGFYVIRLSVADEVGLINSDEVSLFFNTEPPAPIITSPHVDAFWRGGLQKNITWTIFDPGDLLDFTIDFSINNGLDWETISVVASTSRSIPWTVPVENSSSSLMRVVSRDIDGNTATSTNSFTIDSEAPIITIGGIGTTTVATTTKTMVTDNIDDENELTYLWSAIVVPSGGTLTFSPSRTVMDPIMSGTVTGYYTAQIIVFDRTGHISTDLVTFYWEGNPEIPILTNPDSTVIIKGGATQLIEWYMPEPDPGDLDYFDIRYSTDGLSWNLITSGLASTTRNYLWTSPDDLSSTSTVIKVEVYDTASNLSYGNSPNFTIDSTPPVVSTGIISSPISVATSSVGVMAIDNFDDEEFISFNWTVLSEPYANATLTIASSTATSTDFYGDISGLYEVLLSATDRAGNVGTSSLSFIWLNEHDPVLIEPKTGDHLRGGATSTAIWTFNDPGDLDHLEAFYSVDNGDNWLMIDSSIASTSTSIIWDVPEVNSTSSLFRIVTVDTLDRRATSTSGLFTIDSEAPVVDAGSFSGDVNSPTAPNASSTDNFSLPEEMTYIWTPSSLSYGGGFNILNPTISAGVNGTYIATLTVYDKAGNFSSDTVAFTRNVTNAPGGGGGGGGGGSIQACSEVTYGDWSACFNGFQTRSIISSVPSSCTPTATQQALQTQVCGSGSLNYCAEVFYGEWGECINGTQTRLIINQYPSACTFSSSQISATTKACGEGGPFDSDALDVMERARLDFTTEDKNLVKRLIGQILIQVEDLGRAWYVNPNDGRRYYLGSPTNAFSVMSLIGRGIKNDLLKKLPIGLLDPKLSNDKDTDGDGLTDRLEEGVGTDLNKKDTDGDGFSDYQELTAGYDPLDSKPKKSIIDQKLLANNLGQIFIQVETNGEAWYVEPKTKKRYYLGRPLEAFNIMRQFGVGITNEDLNKIPVGQFSETQLKRIVEMFEERKRKIEQNKL